MKKTLTIFALAAAAFALNAQNLFVNGGFEKLDRWGKALHRQDFASIELVTDDVQEGKTALKFTFTEKPKVYICVSQNCNIKPGTKAVDVSLKYKSPEGGGTILFSQQGMKAQILTLKPAADWTEVKYQVAIAEGAKYFRTEIRYAKKGTLLVDALEGKAVTEAK